MAIGTLDRRYTGKLAAQYDTCRQDSPRWQAEINAFSRYFSQVAPTSVLDCPFGTGRWLEWYRTVSGPVIALDKSADMLAVAKGKSGQAWPANIACQIVNVFDHDFSQYRANSIDLLVCVRFLNWFPAKVAKQILRQLAKAEIKHSIIGVSVLPTQLSKAHQLCIQGYQFYDNVKTQFRRDSKQYIHSEPQVKQWFAELGWKIKERTFIFENATRQNFFYLLARQ